MNIRDKLNEIIRLNWTEVDFGCSRLKADYKKQLSDIYHLDSLNNLKYQGKEITIPVGNIMYTTDVNGKEEKFVSATTKRVKKDDSIKVTFKNSFPPFAKLVIDYLLGRYVFYNGQLYDVNNRQAKMIDDIRLANLYGFKHGTEFILDILKGIDKHFHTEPIRVLKPFQIDGNDFIIDLEKHTLTRCVLNNEISFLKYYQVDFETAKSSKEIANKFLHYVIEDPDSFHNAQLQTYYIAQVASGLKSKTNFFITKSGVRTGKGLRHTALSGLFNKIDVELDNLVSKGFDALNAWAMFSGGEMALATEQGDIIGDRIERVLKIIATEKTHVARMVGGNQGLVLLSSVLCIDTNRNVSLSDEMNGRKVLIQYKDRPVGETDLEREEAFAEYWEAFTLPDKSPRIEGCIGFLLSSLDYFNEQEQKFVWKNVEVYNGEENLDDFQLTLINLLQKTDFVLKTGDYIINELYKETYGKNNNEAGKALTTIGVERKRKKLDGKLVSGYVVGNQKRFDTFVTKEEERELRVDFSTFEELEGTQGT